MKKILCPTDFSATSHNAITYAAKLAQITGCDLALLNVQSLSDITPIAFIKGTQFTIKATSDRLQTLSMDISKVFGIQCTAEVESTNLKLSTVIAEKSDAYDLLVMGSNGADDLYQLFFGTNTYQALVKARTPVLIIPDGQLYGEIRNILYAFDYLSQRKLPLAPLVDFARALKSEITVLQVMEEARSKEADEDLRELQFILQTRAEGGFPLKFQTIRSSNVAPSIDAFVSESSPDILALCLQDRNFIEKIFHTSVIKTISATSSYPVFVFPE